MKYYIIIILAILLTGSVMAIPNPAALHCIESGNTFKIKDTEKGQIGICVVNNIELDAWEFFQGKVGREYSLCAKKGFEIETKKDGKSKYSKEYAVCLVDEKIKKYEKFPKKNGKREVPIEEFLQIEETPIQSPPTVQGQVSWPPPPTEFNWHNLSGTDWMSPVKSQGSCGSCWAFATVGTLEGQINVDNGMLLNEDLSEEELTSDCSDAGDCRGGSTYWAFLYVKESGLSEESCFPYVSSTCQYNWNNFSCMMDWCTYDCANSICADKCSGGNMYTISDYVSSGEDAKSIIANHGPVSAFIYMDGYFNLSEDDIYRCLNPDSGAHAITLVGFDDEKNYWIAKNSWGITWPTIDGDGYFKIAYNNCSIIPEFYVLEPRLCITPQDGMVINQTTKFCTADYYLPNGITIAADNIVLDCSFSNITGNFTPNLAGVAFSSQNNITIKNCNLNNFYYGLYSYITNNNNILNNKMSNGHFGIYLINTQESIVRDNTLLNNQWGLFIGNGINNLITKNYLSNNYDGISFAWMGPNTASHNTIENDNGSGIYLIGDTSDSIINNTLLHNQWGVYMTGANDSFLYHNTIEGNMQGVHITSTPTKNTKAYYNVIQNNPLYNFYNNYPNPVNATFNYWGTTIESEIQAELFGIVEYDPWLCAPFTPCYDCALRIYTGKNLSDGYKEIEVWCNDFKDNFPQNNLIYPQREKAVLHYVENCSYPFLIQCCSEAEIQVIVNEYAQSFCSLFDVLACADHAQNQCIPIGSRAINLTQGWNLVSSPYANETNVTIALASIEGCYQGIYSYVKGIWAQLIPGQFNRIQTLKPDKGYWIKVNCTYAEWTV